MRRAAVVLLAVCLANLGAVVAPGGVGAVPGTANVIPCAKTFRETLIFGKFRSFANGTTPQMTVGIPASGSLRGRATGLRGGWTSGTNVIEFAYNRTTDRLTSRMTNGLSQQWVWTYDNVSSTLASLGHVRTVDDLNTLLVTVANRDAGTTVNLRNVTIDAVPLDADQSTPAVDDFLASPSPQLNRWTVSGLDFSGGFLIHADVEIAGTFSTSADLSRVDFQLGYIAPSTPTVSVRGGAAIEGSGYPIPFRSVVGGTVLSPVSVDYQTSDGGATQPGDYTASSGTLTFQPCGPSSLPLDVTVASDASPESLETMSMALSNPVGGAIGVATETGTITENPADISVSIGDARIREGDSRYVKVRYPVLLNHAVANPVAVQFQIFGGSATAGTDYRNQLPKTLSFAPGVTTSYLEMRVYGENIAEADESIVSVLSSPVGATIGDAAGAVTIADDDSPTTGTSVAYVSDAWVTEGHSGARAVNFTIALTRDAPGRNLVNYQTVAGTATAGSDFTARSGQVALSTKGHSAVVSVQLLPDAAVEGDESFNLEITSVVGSALVSPDPNGTATIRDDD